MKSKKSANNSKAPKDCKKFPRVNIPSDCENNYKAVSNTYCENCHNNHVQSNSEIIHNSSQPPSPAPQRLNKAISGNGFCSRRKADELIFAGQVMVNGNLVTEPGMKVSHTDVIAVNGQILDQSPTLLTVMLNKPIHTVCTMQDPQGRKKVIDLLPQELQSKRLFPVGRLDYFSEGLLLLTNDGALAQMLTHPKHHQAKVYEVLVRGIIPDFALKIMRDGMGLDEKTRLLPVKVEVKLLANGNTLLTMKLRQGVNRQIRRMCTALGITVLRLVRIKLGPLNLGNLPKGKWRLLTDDELQSLKK